MERLSGHAELQELLGAYAIDAVEPEEAAVLELHLSSCPRCRDELAQHREVAAMLGYAGGQAPKGVWDRIISSLEEPPPPLDLLPTRPSNPIARVLQFPSWGLSQSSGERAERERGERHGRWLAPAPAPDPANIARRWGRPGILRPVAGHDNDADDLESLEFSGSGGREGPGAASAATFYGSSAQGAVSDLTARDMAPADPADWDPTAADPTDEGWAGSSRGASAATWRSIAQELRSGRPGALPRPTPPSTIGRDAARQMELAVRTHRSVPMRFMVAVAAAAAVIVAALGIEVGRLETHKSQQPSLAALAYRLADADPTARHFTLVSPDGIHTVRAVIISDGETFLGPGNLPVLPSNETYQMWGIVDGSKVSLGVIGDDPTYAAFTTPVVASALAMTVEARGGVVSTSQTPVVATTVS